MKIDSLITNLYKSKMFKGIITMNINKIKLLNIL